ncbi:MAG: hypothetical protein PSV13_11705 [Lacunisphaera sp.]|nr:hypothetical protein [Lacunisphaera sp.]
MQWIHNDNLWWITADCRSHFGDGLIHERKPPNRLRILLGFQKAYSSDMNMCDNSQLDCSYASCSGPKHKTKMKSEHMLEMFGSRVVSNTLFGRLASIIGGACIILAMTALSPAANATTTTIFYDGPYSAYGSATIDLNNYSSTTITNLYLYVESGAASQSDSTIFCYLTASIDATTGSIYYYDDFSSGQYGVSQQVTVSATNITKNGSGHWIAAELTTPDGTTYNVDLGTGSLDILGAGSGSEYGTGSAYCSITY